MPSHAREVFPGIPHHITQQSARRRQIFFSADDYRYYLSLVEKRLEGTKAQICSYCLMPNHIHLIIIPDSFDDLRAVVAEVHRSYTRRINKREECTGALW